jgi:ubiquinone/menaquinone biosynthesis C-methylase UbiE
MRGCPNLLFLASCARELAMGSETAAAASTLIPLGRDAWGIVRCPSCHSTGCLHDSHWHCSSCDRHYPRYSRIVDFRVDSTREDLSFAHLQAVNDEKKRITGALHIAAQASFEEMVDNYFKDFPTNPEIEQGEKGTLLHADDSAREVLFQIEQTLSIAELAARPCSVAMEVGCGAAGLAGILARSFSSVIALDADLDRMVLAQKHCDELGIENVLLLCAFGESMPLASDAIDFISCVEVIEHASSQIKLLSELRRTLRAGGQLYLTTPNRFSAGLEPHVHLWALGWLPRRLMDPYVRFRLGLPYVGKRNLSFHELGEMMGSIFGADFRFRRPVRSRYTAQARVANFLLKIPVLASVLQLIVAGYHVNACKRRA